MIALGLPKCAVPARLHGTTGCSRRAAPGCLVGCNEAPRLVLARLAKSRGRSPGSGEPASEITGGQAGGQAGGGGSLSLSPELEAKVDAAMAEVLAELRQEFAEIHERLDDIDEKLERVAKVVFRLESPLRGFTREGKRAVFQAAAEQVAAKGEWRLEGPGLGGRGV